MENVRTHNGDWIEKEELPLLVPYLCAICRGPFLKSVFTTRTRCNHFFCETCAEKHHKKTDRCFVCEEPTLGVFKRGILLYSTDPVKIEREKARAKVKYAADILREALKYVNENKIKMMKHEGILAAKAVKIAENVETLFEKLLETEIKAGETAKDAFQFVEDAIAAIKTMEAKMVKAFRLMVKHCSERSKKRFVEEAIAKMVVKLESERLNNRKKRFGGFRIKRFHVFF